MFTPLYNDHRGWGVQCSRGRSVGLPRSVVGPPHFKLYWEKVAPHPTPQRGGWGWLQKARPERVKTPTG